MATSIFPWRSIFAATDEQMMWRVRVQDDPQAFAKLVQRWQKPIRNLCSRMTGDVHRGEDLAQETFARLFARRKAYLPTSKFSTFLWRIALNICYDDLRRSQRRPEAPLPGQDSDEDSTQFECKEPAPDRHLIESERAKEVRRALGELPEHYRAVVVLRHYEGLKFREIGEVLSIPEGTVKSRMSEALSQLGRLLNPLLRDEPKSLPAPPEKLLI